MRGRPFNWMTRQEILSGLPQDYDLIIVGGGIIGCGTALEASQRGYSVLLLEKGDLGSGTSSKTSRLVHGGLRYLKYGKLKVVHQATRERYWLRTHYPHLVTPVTFLIPFYRGVGEGPLATLIGLWLYDILSGFSNVGRHRRLGVDEVLSLEPALRSDGLDGGALYYDCLTDDARLVLHNALKAHEAGADIVTYARVESLLQHDGRVRGVRFLDVLSGEMYEARGELVINATGPWGDQVRLMHPSGKPRLRPTKGIHVLVPRSRVGNREAVVMRSPADDRVVFALPWREFSLLGTTDTDFQGSPDEVRAEAGDVDYLLEATNFTFPQANLQRSEVVSSYAGLRPLVAEHGVPESEVARDFRIAQDAPGLLSIFGGKLTTYRRAARKAVSMLRGQVREARATSTAPGENHELPLTQREMIELRAEMRKGGKLEDDIIEHLLQAYGRSAREVSTYLKQQDLASRLVFGLPYVLAEVIHSVEHEMALRLEDILVRRMGMAYEDRQHGLGVAGKVAAMMAGPLEWEAERVDAELRGYEQHIAAINAFRKGD